MSPFQPLSHLNATSNIRGSELKIYETLASCNAMEDILYLFFKRKSFTLEDRILSGRRFRARKFPAP